MGRVHGATRRGHPPTAQRATSRRHTPARSGVLAVVTGAALLGGPLLAAPSLAATEAPATTCTADEETACVGVLVLDPHNDLLGDVDVTISGPEDFSVDVTTSADGLISIPVTVAGTYTVTVDSDTFPADAALPDSSPDSQKIEATLGATGRAVFRGGSTTAIPREATSAADANDDTTSAGWMLWVLIGAAALALVVLVMLARRRGQRP